MTKPSWVRNWFRGAAIYGVVVLAPLLFVESSLTASGHPLSQPESFYGFTMAALVFQGMFWIIGGDPVRFRPLMLVAVAEKLAFFVPVAILFAGGRTAATTLGFGLIDLLLGIGFLLAWRATPPA